MKILSKIVLTIALVWIPICSQAAEKPDITPINAMALVAWYGDHCEPIPLNTIKFMVEVYSSEIDLKEPWVEKALESDYNLVTYIFYLNRDKYCAALKPNIEKVIRLSNGSN